MSAVSSGRMSLIYNRQDRQDYDDIPIIELHTGKIEDGTPIATARFLVSHPEMKHYFGADLIIALFYGQRTALGADRDEYAALADILINEVKWVIAAFISILK
jgi:hypothetical protein